jgi:hypothetical protein
VDRLNTASGSLAINQFSPASFADNDDLSFRQPETPAYCHAVMQGLPLGGDRRKRIQDGVALYSPAIKIRTAARLCHGQTRKVVPAEVLRRSLFR